MKNEWRVPLTVIMFSSLIFVALTFLFGFEVDRITGEMVITSAVTNTNMDQWTYDPMVAVWGSFWRYWCIAGYFGAISIFSIAWFDFMKWDKIHDKK